MRGIDLVVFDYDGVLVDSFPGTHRIYQLICADLGKSCPTDLEEFRKLFGLTFNDCFLHLGIHSDQEKCHAGVVYKREITMSPPPAFAGVGEVLAALRSRDVRLAIASSGYDDAISSAVHRFGWHGYFEGIYARTHEPSDRHVGKSDFIRRAVECSRVSLAGTVHIDDMTVGYREARNAGVERIVLVDYGWGWNPALLPEYAHPCPVRFPRDILDALDKL